GQSGKGDFEDRAHMPARDCVWRQPSDADRGPSIQLSRKLARYWANSVEQEQVRHAHGHNPNSPNKGATPAPGALPPNPASTEMQNLLLTLPGPSARGCLQSSRAQRLAGNRRERSWDHEQLPY